MVKGSAMDVDLSVGDLSKTLDELISAQKAKTARSRTSGSNRGRGRGGARRGQSGRKPRGFAATQIRKSLNRRSLRGRGATRGATPQGKWRHDKYPGGRRAQAARGPLTKPRAQISTTGTVIVSGLHGHVTSDDVQEIFGRVGIVTSAYVMFNKQGQSTGNAKVTFAKRADARKAVSELDNVNVDEKPIRVRIDASGGAATNFVTGQRGGAAAAGRGRGRGRRRGRGFRGNAGGQGAGGPMDTPNPLSRTNNLTMSTFGRNRGGWRSDGMQVE